MSLRIVKCFNNKFLSFNLSGELRFRDTKWKRRTSCHNELISKVTVLPGFAGSAKNYNVELVQ